VWHASVALQTPIGPLPTHLMTEDTTQMLRLAARKLLRGVGQLRNVWEIGDVAIHLRRRVKPSEYDWQATDERP